jgi:predicted dithiol-disulfide oxidoreductase (DUF899 family)
LSLAESPCPSCTALPDQLDGAAEHARQHINFAVVAETSLQRLLTFADERGWRRLRLLSSAGNTYNRDYHGDTTAGVQRPMLNVFHRDTDTIRHFWGSELLYAPTDGDQEPRHVGTLEPLWNLFDLTPEGRPNNWWERRCDPSSRSTRSAERSSASDALARTGRSGSELRYSTAISAVRRSSSGSIPRHYSVRRSSRRRRMRTV